MRIWITMLDREVAAIWKRRRYQQAIREAKEALQVMTEFFGPHDRDVKTAVEHLTDFFRSKGGAHGHDGHVALTQYAKQSGILKA